MAVGASQSGPSGHVFESTDNGNSWVERAIPADMKTGIEMAAELDNGRRHA